MNKLSNNNALSFQESIFISYLERHRKSLNSSNIFQTIDDISSNLDNFRGIVNEKFAICLPLIFETTLKIAAEENDVTLRSEIVNQSVIMIFKGSKLNTDLYKKISRIVAIIFLKDKNILLPVSYIGSKIINYIDHLIIKNFDDESTLDNTILLNLSSCALPEHSNKNIMRLYEEIKFEGLSFETRFKLLKAADQLNIETFIKKHRNLVMAYFFSKPFKEEIILEDLVRTYEFCLIAKDDILRDEILHFLISRIMLGYGYLLRSSEIYKKSILALEGIDSSSDKIESKIFISCLGFNAQYVVAKFIKDNILSSKIDQSSNIALVSCYLYILCTKNVDDIICKIEPFIEQISSRSHHPFPEMSDIAFYSYMTILYMKARQKQHMEVYIRSLKDILIKVIYQDQKHPSDLNKVTKYYLQNNLEQYVEATDTILKLASNGVPYALEELAIRFQIENQPEEALNLFEKIENTYNIFPVLSIRKAETLLSLERFDGHLQLAVSTTQLSPILCCWYVFWNLLSDKTEPAKALFNEYKALNIMNKALPHEKLYMSLFKGIIDYRIGLHDDAFKIFLFFMKMLPGFEHPETHPAFNTLIASVAVEMKMKIDPELKIDHSLLNKIAFEKFDSDDFESGLTLLRHLIEEREFDVDDNRIYLQDLAIDLLQSGKLSKAVTLYKLLIKEYKFNIMENLLLMRSTGSEKILNGNIIEGVVIFRILIDDFKNTEDINVLFELSKKLIQTGKYSNAVELLMHLIKYPEREEEVRNVLIDLRETIFDTDRALCQKITDILRFNFEATKSTKKIWETLD